MDTEAIPNEEYLRLFRIDKLLSHMVRQLVARKPTDPSAFLRRYLETTGDEGDESEGESGDVENLGLLHKVASVAPEVETAPLPRPPAKPSLLHQCITNINNACQALGAQPTDTQAERWGMIVYEAMSGANRRFHSAQHAIDIGGNDDPLEILAGAFHDVVYVQVDKGFPARIAAELSPLASEAGPAAWKLAEGIDEKNVLIKLVLRIFGMKPGSTISIFGGFNELMSAIAAALELGSILSLQNIAVIATAIAGTIPFLPNAHFENLYQRLLTANISFDLKFTPAELEQVVHTTVRVANRDVSNFAMTDVGQFLDNTWELMPEGSPALSNPGTYTIRDFRIALGKMEGFLSRLNPMNVFHSFKGIPSIEEMNANIRQVQENLGLSVAYLRVKLYTMGLFEALAACTGGADVPIVFFMGAAPGHGIDTPRFHSFLPSCTTMESDMNPVVWRLLSTGRYSDSPSFDLKASPASAFVYRRLGSSKTLVAVDKAKGYFSGEVTASDFLDMQDPYLVTTFASAAAHIAGTRRRELENIASSFEARTPRPGSAASFYHL